MRKHVLESIDANADGLLEVDEITVLLDPRNPSHAVFEAYLRGVEADRNGDHELSWEEVRDSAGLHAMGV